MATGEVVGPFCHIAQSNVHENLQTSKELVYVRLWLSFRACGSRNLTSQPCYLKRINSILIQRTWRFQKKFFFCMWRPKREKLEILTKSKNICPLIMEIYLVQTEFPYNHRANKLTKFIRKSEKFADVLFIIVHIYIKFQDQIHYGLATPKKRNFWQICEIRSVKIFVFFLLFHSYEFDFETLYIDEVGSTDEFLQKKIMNFVSSFAWKLCLHMIHFC
jgi:hypothetical protein